jgi:hypothetical protein
VPLLRTKKPIGKLSDKVFFLILVAIWDWVVKFLKKGQIISGCPYEIIVSPKRPKKKCLRFLP